VSTPALESIPKARITAPIGPSTSFSLNAPTLDHRKIVRRTVDSLLVALVIHSEESKKPTPIRIQSGGLRFRSKADHPPR
jgi:hypothetical protein